MSPAAISSRPQVTRGKEGTRSSRRCARSRSEFGETWNHLDHEAVVGELNLQRRVVEIATGAISARRCYRFKDSTVGPYTAGGVPHPERQPVEVDPGRSRLALCHRHLLRDSYSTPRSAARVGPKVPRRVATVHAMSDVIAIDGLVKRFGSTTAGRPCVRRGRPGRPPGWRCRRARRDSSAVSSSLIRTGP